MGIESTCVTFTVRCCTTAAITEYHKFSKNKNLIKLNRVATRYSKINNTTRTQTLSKILNK